MKMLWVVAILFCSPAMSFALECPIVSVRAKKVVEGHRFIQVGEGWSFQVEGDKNVYLLTPAHVVFDADEVQGDCQQRSINMERIGSSDTLDLAVYRFEQEEKPKEPVIAMLELSRNQNGKGFEIKRNFDFSSKIKGPSQAVTLYFKNGVLDSLPVVISAKEEVLKKSKDFPQYDYVFLNRINAIRPGMSGSGFFNLLNQPPVGMNLKTLLNDHVSFILPTELILSYLPDLLQGRDPWKERHPHLWIQFSHSLNKAAKILERSRQLVAIDPLTKHRMLLREVCAIGRIVESSQWLPVHGAWVDHGGSWVDHSGNGTKIRALGGSKKTTTYTGDSLPGMTNWPEEIPRELIFALVPNQYFLNEQECSEEGLLLMSPHGVDKLIAYRDRDGSLTKVSDLETMLKKFIELESSNQNYMSFIEKQKVTAANPPRKFESICNSRLMGQSFQIAGAKVDSSESRASIPKGLWDLSTLKQMFRQTEHQDLNAAYLLIREKKYLQSSSDNELVYIKCSDKQDEINIKAANSDLSFDLSIEPHRMSGSFSIQDIDHTYNFSVTTGNYWNYFYQNDQFAISVSLDPSNDPLVSLKILKIPPEERRFGSVGFNNVTPELKLVDIEWYSLEPLVNSRKKSPHQGGDDSQPGS